MSHLKDCLVESPSLAGNADGENEVEGVKVKNTKNVKLGNFCKAQKRRTCKNMTPGENYQGQGNDLFACKGRVRLTKWMKFRKNSKTPLTPPLVFRK